MSLTIGLPNPGAVTIGGKTAATINALSEANEHAAAEALGKDAGDTKQVRTGGGPVQEEAPAESGGNQSITIKILLKRMKELQQQLQEQQQQLAAAQAASYPTEEAKTTVVMSIQGQIADTNAALMEVAGNLVREMAKGAGSGGVINTTA